MRNLIITREKSFVGCFGIMKVYIEDPLNPEIKINNTPCRKLGTLKNGEQKSFPIDDNSAKVFVIADKLSKNFYNEFFDLPAGNFDVAVKGKNHYNPFAGNPFRFEGTANEEVLANRKRTKKKSYIIMAIALVVGILWGIVGSFFGSEAVAPEIFTREGMSITLTNEFMYVPQDGFTVCYGSEDYAVFAVKEEFTLFDKKISLYEYAGYAVAGSDIEVADYEGLVCFEYVTESEDGTEYCYFATAFETADAFWLVQFASETEQYEEAFPIFVEWAKSVSFE